MAQIQEKRKMSLKRTALRSLVLVTLLGFGLSACSTFRGQKLAEAPEDLSPETASSPMDLAKGEIPQAPVLARAQSSDQSSSEWQSATEIADLLGSDLQMLEPTSPDSGFYSGSTVSILNNEPAPVAAPIAPPVSTPVITYEQDASSDYITADGQPYPAFDDTGLPVASASSTAPVSLSQTSASPVSYSGYALHLASYRLEKNAVAGWQQLERDNSDILAGLNPVISELDIAGKGHFLRLKAAQLATKQEAENLCGQLKARGVYCAVMSAEGQSLF
jgi:SPOR domain